MATHSSLLAWNNPTDRGAWWATVSGVSKSEQLTLSPVNSPAELLGSVASSHHTIVGAHADSSCFRRFITLPSQNLRFVTLSLFSLCCRHKLWLYFLSF